MIKNNNFNESKIINKQVLIGFLVISITLLLGYTIETIKGSRTITYLLTFSLLLLFPIIVVCILYKKNPTNKIIRHIFSSAFSLFYIFLIFTDTTNLAFLFALPVLTVFTLYKDWKFSLKIGIGTTLVNCIYVIYNALHTTITALDIANYEIQIACVVLTSAFMVIASKTINDIFEQKLSVIKEQNAKQNLILNNTMTIASKISDDITNITAEAKSMEKQSLVSKNAMEEISTGTNEVVSNIQSQLEMGSNINTLISDAKDLANNIKDKFQSTKINTD